jgi:eukaryotic-like serine/threonine-protein kinase
LVDFGNSRWKYGQTEEKRYYGTPGYAAPEQYRGDMLNEQTDIYGIGALCYYCLTGKKPQEYLLFPKSEPVLEEIIRRCLRHRPAKRYSSVSELQHALKCLQTNQESVKESTSLYVSVAGAMPGIGVTHLSLAFAGHINRHGIPCIYQECNSSKAALAIAREKHLSASSGVYQLQGIPVLPYYGQNVKEAANSGSMCIQDFGVLTEENLAEFLAADRHILLLGNKVWQIEESERKKRMLAGERIWYLVNFSEPEEFLAYQRQAEEPMYRIPYFPAYQKPGYVGERFLDMLFESAAGRGVGKKQKIKKIWVRKKGV